MDYIFKKTEKSLNILLITVFNNTLLAMTNSTLKLSLQLSSLIHYIINYTIFEHT